MPPVCHKEPELLSCTSSDGTVTYGYDSLAQLTSATYTDEALPDEAYSYDSNGNPEGEGVVVGPDNQLLCDGTYCYTYDSDGNRTSRFVWTDADADGQIDPDEKSEITEYGWDVRNRLTTVTQRDSSTGPATQVVHYYYDLENRWIGQTVDPDGETGTSPLEITRFAYDGPQIVLQFEGTAADSSGEPADPLTPAALTHRYLWGPAVDQFLADEQLTTPGTEEVLWPLTDHLGTVRDLASYDPITSTTSVVDHLVYNSFGRLLSETNAAIDHLFAFTGRPFDKATGLQNNLNRWYDPEAERWISEDPAGFQAGDLNSERYAASSPTTIRDPLGTKGAPSFSPGELVNANGVEFHPVKLIDSGAGTRLMLLEDIKGESKLTMPLETYSTMVFKDVPLGYSGGLPLGVPVSPSLATILTTPPEKLSRPPDVIEFRVRSTSSNAELEDFERQTVEWCRQVELLCLLATVPDMVLAPLAEAEAFAARTAEVRTVAARAGQRLEALLAEDAAEAAAQAAPNAAPKMFAEVIEGFSILGNRRLVGSVFEVRITMFAGKATPDSVKALAAALESQARAAGGKSIRIIGQAAGEHVMKPGLAEKLGYIFKRIDEHTFELFKNL